MRYSFQRLLFSLFAVSLLITGLAACNNSPVNITPTPTPVPFYTFPTGGSCVKLGAHPQAPYANIRVSHDSYLAHSEPMLAEDPNNPLHLVGGSKFFTDPAHYRFQIGYYTSFDGGCTWTDGGILPGFDKTILTSDPTFAFGPNNRVYASVLDSVPSLNGESGIDVFTSTDGGKTFAAPVKVYSNATGRIFNDKPWIGVDNTHGPYRGNIYMVWSYDHGASCDGAGFCQQELAFSRSTNGGKSFSPVQLIEGKASFCTDRVPGRQVGSTACDEALGAIPVVEPDGTIAVAFAYEDPIDFSVPTRLLVVTSSDGGKTWTQPVLAATIHDTIGVFPPEKYRTASLPTFACDPRTGQLYLAWADKGKRDADILLTTSKDSGQTWSTPVRVNDDPVGNGANQFQPQLAVAPDGVVSVSFFDTRIDPQHKLIDVYLGQSIDQGRSFLKNIRVTTQSWDPAVDAPVDENGLQFIGDYQGLSSDDHFVHPFWNDTRTGRQEIFTAAIPSAELK
ncbi:MAG TPA: hypothetical protein VKV20_14780 [Ktedonobacteraceae bacterium]|jgi:hypothetical protein|nr:hypothetical protein [Ktedonobacteraceae bacterium]